MRTSGTKVQAEEVGIVLVVLLLWAAAIALFINRWGKIRQMEPYHPYVEETEAPSQQPPNPASIPQSNQVNKNNNSVGLNAVRRFIVRFGLRQGLFFNFLPNF